MQKMFHFSSRVRKIFVIIPVPRNNAPALASPHGGECPMSDSGAISKDLIGTLSHQLKSLSPRSSRFSDRSDGFTGETNAQTLQFIGKALKKAAEPTRSSATCCGSTRAPPGPPRPVRTSMCPALRNRWLLPITPKHRRKHLPARPAPDNNGNCRARRRQGA